MGGRGTGGALRLEFVGVGASVFFCGSARGRCIGISSWSASGFHLGLGFLHGRMLMGRNKKVAKRQQQLGIWKMRESNHSGFDARHLDSLTIPVVPASCPTTWTLAHYRQHIATGVGLLPCMALRIGGHLVLISNELPQELQQQHRLGFGGKGKATDTDTDSLLLGLGVSTGIHLACLRHRISSVGLGRLA
jgi:hypothetical protein